MERVNHDHAKRAVRREVRLKNGDFSTKRAPSRTRAGSSGPSQTPSLTEVHRVGTRASIPTERESKLELSYMGDFDPQATEPVLGGDLDLHQNTALLWPIFCRDFVERR
jgi:hypothetical protein